MVYISKQLCLKAFEERKNFSKVFIENKEQMEFMNDESFLMNAIDKRKYKYKSLDEIYNVEFDQYYFTSSGNLNKIEINKINKKEGFFHPIVIIDEHIQSIIRHQKNLYKQKSFK